MSQDLKISYHEKHEMIQLFQDLLGRNILEVEIAGSSRFFDTKEFEAPVGGSVSAAPFFTFKGLDITKFMVNNVFVEHNGNIETMKSSWDNFVSKAKYHNFKFSDRHIWRYFS